jgi:hypothetical protein
MQCSFGNHGSFLKNRANYQCLAACLRRRWNTGNQPALFGIDFNVWRSIMSRLLSLALGALLMSGAAAQAADQPPQLNVETTCRVAAQGGTGRNQDACLSDGKTAQNTLAGKWKQFNATQQKRCTDLISMGGPPSYVELLTCLEMAEQARKIPDRDALESRKGMKPISE